jgi:DNA-binding NarL/FixJ family response regulator
MKTIEAPSGTRRRPQERHVAERRAREVATPRESIVASLDGLVAAETGGGQLAWLSKRELEVLSLMAAGLSDRGIAERLWLTQKTVESHSRSIFRKLRLPSDRDHNRRVSAVVTYLSR